MPAVPSGPCPKCSTEHDPTRCQAHSKLRAGGQCGNRPLKGLTVCRTHGGNTARARAAGKNRQAAAQLREQLGTLYVTPVDNPLRELQVLAGEARAWKELCAAHVAKLERMRYGTEGGEAIRGEIVLFERAMDRCAQILAIIAKLNIDERLVRIAEGQKDMILRALEAGLSTAGVTGDAARTAKQAAARHLRVVASHQPQPTLTTPEAAG